MSEDKTLDYYELLGVPDNASQEQIFTTSEPDPP